MTGMAEINFKALLDGALSQTVWVYPVRRDAYTEPRYTRWWQGWLDIGLHLAVDDDGEPAGRYLTWKGPRLAGLYRVEAHWDESYNPDTGEESVWQYETRVFCGWRELLRPMNNRHRDVEVMDCGVEVPVIVDSGSIKLADIWFNGKDGNPMPPVGSIIGIAVRSSSSDELLWAVNFPQPRDIEADNNLVVSDVGVSLS